MPSGEQRKKGTRRCFNKKFAYDIKDKLNAKSPDISAAFLLQSLLTWKRWRRHPYGGRVQGSVYLSLAKIAEDLPWLSRSAINDAIRRMEKALKDDFHVVRKSNCEHNFILSETLEQAYSRKTRLVGKGAEFKFISVRVEDAVELGVLKAILVSNLEYKTDPKRSKNPLVDAEGQIYGEMSASVLSNPSNRAKTETEQDKLPILPFSRQAIQGAIAELGRDGWFIVHPERRGFFRLNRPQNTSECTNGNLSPNRSELSPNCTELSTNCTELSTNPTVSSDEIERQIEIRLKQMESDIFTSTGAEGPAVDVNECDFHNSPDGSTSQPEDPHSVQGSVLFAPSSAPIMFKDAFPALMAEINQGVERYHEWRKTSKLEVIDPADLPYDYITDAASVIWEEEGLLINPLTLKPVDLSNFDELIDIAMDQLSFPTSFTRPTHKASMATFRNVFHKHNEVTVTMMQTMLDSISFAQQPSAHYIIGSDDDWVKKPRGCQYNDQYFAKLVTSPKLFVRYFQQLFVETFAPYMDEGEVAWSPEGIPLRSWTIREELADSGIPDYPKTYNYDEVEDPFRIIFQDAIESEIRKVNSSANLVHKNTTTSKLT